MTGVLEEEVDFVEGQTVKKGDILAKIDPRLYQGRPGPEQGQLAKDTALHAQAQSSPRAAFKRLAERTSITDPTSRRPARFHRVCPGCGPPAGHRSGSDQKRPDAAGLYDAAEKPFDGVTGILQIQIGNLIQPSNTTGIMIMPSR